ncbi:BQ2448_7512 [Microbotryum intermedium]|uniref:BQ2448_7512 protein n=1 Tax=Microbotryum intermedium TaxID=269621 RepID=A0A238FR60_9BASI|nr:BQ2448_7512 [Microbotryum intermedium]
MSPCSLAQRLPVEIIDHIASCVTDSIGHLKDIRSVYPTLLAVASTCQAWGGSFSAGCISSCVCLTSARRRTSSMADNWPCNWS